MHFLYAAAFILLVVNVLINLPKAVGMAEIKVSSANIFSQIVPTGVKSNGEIAGIEKVNVPPKSLGITPPQILASAALVVDVDTNFPLFTKDANKIVPIASTTKIITALISSVYFKPNQILTVPSDVLSVSGSSMGLKPGEQINYRSLLYGMLLNSGNDAAYTIAQNYPGGEVEFIGAMNDKARSLGLGNTHFDNPAGFDSPNHFSSAIDLAKIALLAINDPQIARIIATKDTIVTSEDKTIVHSLKNLNKLLDTPGVLGVKTGTTPQARENLVGLVDRNNHKILTVVLGSDDRFGETEKLFDWVYQNYSWDGAGLTE